MKNFKVGLCQNLVLMDKAANLKKAEKLIREAAKKGAQVIALPEMFCCPYDHQYFDDYSEEYPGPATNMMSAVAKELSVYIIGGSLPEKRDGKIYNTCYIFGKSGELLAKYSKTHLFDIDIKGKVSFKESDSLEKGKEIVTFDTEFGRFGIGICYDIRFPELSKLMVDQGAEMIFMPGAFNTTTGPAHWDLTLRARAVDNQVYFAVISLARDMNFSYHAYGFSGVSDPWGEIIGQCDEKEGVVVCDIDAEKIKRIREQLPLLKHRRNDLYSLKEIK